LKLKIKKLQNDKIKSDLTTKIKIKFTLLFHDFCLLVTPKITYKRQRGGEITISGNTNGEQQWANGNNNNKGAHFKQSK
jgi:hypothetical protein